MPTTPRPVKVTVENADELLNAGAFGAGALIQIQSSATETGTYADLTGTGSTPTIALVSGTRAYTGYDPSGDWATWYRVRYKSSDATRVSVDWTSDTSWASRAGHAPFQAGDEGGGLLCSLYDAKQRLFPPSTTDTSEDENILEYIRQASAFLERETERWFAPRPLSGTTTYVLETTYGSTLWVPKGIRSITTLAIATQDQPDTGGTYTTQTSTTYAILPATIERSPGWPGTKIQFLSSGGYFYDAIYGAQIVGAFGFASVPTDVQSAALDLVEGMHRARGSGGTGSSFTVNVDGSRTFDRLPDSVRRVITTYRTPNVG